VDIGLAVLAGGIGRRMGADKAMLEVEGEPMLSRLARLALGAGFEPVWVAGRAHPVPGNREGVRTLPDDLPGTGPLGGIATVLRRTDRVFAVLAVDHPAIDRAALEWLLESARGLADDAPGLVARRGDRTEPLISVWRPEARGAVEARLSDGDGSVARCIDALRFPGVEIPARHLAAFRSANTPDEWAAARRDARLVGPEEVP